MSVFIDMPDTDPLQTFVDNWLVKRGFDEYWKEYLTKDEFNLCRGEDEQFSWEDLTHCDLILDTASGTSYAQQFMDPIQRLSDKGINYDYKIMMKNNSDLMTRVQEDIEKEINNNFPKGLHKKDRKKWDDLLKKYVKENKEFILKEHDRLYRQNRSGDETLKPILLVYTRLLSFWGTPNYNSGFIYVPSWKF